MMPLAVMWISVREYDPAEVFQKGLGDEGVDPAVLQQTAAAMAGVQTNDSPRGARSGKPILRRASATARMNTYSHVLSDMQTEAATAIEEALW